MIESCNSVDNAAQPDKAAGSRPTSDLLYGARLDGTGGHASQQDIDLMFA
jgi:hypothetical protein